MTKWAKLSCLDEKVKIIIRIRPNLHGESTSDFLQIINVFN
jgi:hypothetical protein